MTTHDPGTTLDQLYRRVTVPLARKIARLSWVTPDRVSLAAFAAGGIATPLLVLARRERAAGIAFILSDLLDYLDGDVARTQGATSPRGDVLDGILDRYTDVACISAMTVAAAGALDNGRRPGKSNHGLAWVVGLAAIIGSLMPSYIQALAVANGRRTVQSIGGRGTRNRVIFTGLLARKPFLSLVVIAILSNIASLHRAIYVLSRSGEVSPGRERIRR